MQKVRLIKPYKHYQQGDVITLENNIAGVLIDDGIARQANVRDYLVNSQFNLGAMTRALKKPN
jgi:hypothetical protein